MKELISQARTTRDLWSGSYLLSWLVAHAASAVQKLGESTSLVFPDPDGQPALDLIAGGEPSDIDALLTPNLGNVFLADITWGVQEAGAQRSAVEQAVASAFDPDPEVGEWGRITAACLAFLEDANGARCPRQPHLWGPRRRHL